MSHRVSSYERGVDHSPGDGREQHGSRTSGRTRKGEPGFGKRRDYTIGHAGRQFRLGPMAFWGGAALVFAMVLWTAGTATYFAFRDDLLTRLIARQADMQYAYEDRIAELRSQIDRLTSRQLLDQEQVEQRIEQLTRRQSTLESRSTALTGLPDAAPTGSIRPGPRAPGRVDPAAGKPSPIKDTVIVAPAPEQHSSLESRIIAPRAQLLPSGPKAHGISGALARIEESLDRVEARQSAVLLAMEDKYDAKARKLRGVLADLGVDLRKIAATPAPAGIGGPLVPVAARADTSAFERQLHRVQLARLHIDRLGKALTAVPVRKPLAGELDNSSGFGVRLDPFIRAPAMHSGLDFRAQTGEPVRATAAGTVVTSGWSGGYGRMVEIDHGNGFSTRYGHLSEILVKEDQVVRPGQIIGRVGTTGRSTGPHLHYETRIDGDAVDPHKFLRAGLRLGEKL